MQSRRIAPPLDLAAELATDDDEPVKPVRAPSKAASTAPTRAQPKPIGKRLVLKRIYRQFPKLRLNELVARAVLAQPKLKLREAEEYFKLRRQQDKQAKATDPKRRRPQNAAATASLNAFENVE
eukprot:COSAG06_NODE_6867_length_2738_cov_25.749147_2_plen_124_part_00